MRNLEKQRWLLADSTRISDTHNAASSIATVSSLQKYHQVTLAEDENKSHHIFNREVLYNIQVLYKCYTSVYNTLPSEL